MNKKLPNVGSTFNKNLTNTEKLTIDNITVLSKICIPIFTAPETPLPYEFMIYADGAWH